MLMLHQYSSNKNCGLVVSFVVTGGRSWSFQIDSELEVFKTEQEKLFVLISITLCANSVETYTSLDHTLWLNNM